MIKYIGELLATIISYIKPEKRFSTSIGKDLKKIVELVSPEFSVENLEGFHSWKSIGKVSFKTENDREKKELLRLKLKTLKKNWTVGNTTSWDLGYSEYASCFLKHYPTLIKKEVTFLLKIIDENMSNTRYHYTFNKYESSVHIVAETLNESLQLEEVIPSIVGKQSYEIVKKVSKAFTEVENELSTIEKLQSEAVEKSLSDRLAAELEFIDKYIEVQ